MEKEPMENETESRIVSPTDMLRADHRKAEELFEAFKEAGEGEKKEIVTQAIRELKIHAAIEEEIFYPAMRREAEEDMIDEALEEHHVVKLLMAELEKMEPGDEHYDAKFSVLDENVKHHIQEEESEMLPKAERSEIRDLAEEMAERKQELEREYSETGGGRTKGRRSSGRTRAKSKKR